MELFDSAGEQQKILGEANVYYLYSSSASQKIFNFNKDSLVIILLRNPVDLIYSLHAQLLYTKNENIIDFSAAWRAQEQRAHTKSIPLQCKDYKVLLYKEMGMLGKQVACISNIFRQEQMKFILFEDFVANPKKIYGEVLSFLKVKGDGRTIFPIINEKCVHKMPSLSIISNRIPLPIQRVVRWGKRVLHIKKDLGVTKTIKALNTVKRKRFPMSDDLRNELLCTFSEDIDLLASLINRDLSHWKK